MTPPSRCPTSQEWQEYLLGRVSDEAAGPMEEHLDQCPACVQLVQTFQAEDPLVAAMRVQAEPRDTHDENLSQFLAQRIHSALRAAGGDVRDTPAGGEESDSDPAPGGQPKVTYPFLGPVRQTGDLGSLGPYRVLDVLGAGGMGVVFRALDSSLKRTVALKMIQSGAWVSEERKARLRTEAEAAARLRHPHIVQIHELGTHDGHPFLVLEYLEGGSLAQKLAGTPQPPGEAAALLETLARAMHHAHEQGIVHRDLKPANVLLTKDGTVKIADFGLAKLVDTEAGQTQTGDVVGTPSYMAPEQASGRVHELGAAVDVYALGAILYETLTGRPPFKGTSPQETVEQVKHEDPVPPRRLQPKLPRDLETICLKCLQKEPRQRYDSTLELSEDLQRFQAGRPIQARPVGLTERAYRWCRRNTRVAALLALLALLATGSFAAVTALWVVAERQRQRAEENFDEVVAAVDGY